MITAEDRERRRLLLDKFERLVWRLNVEARFVRAMQSAAADEPIDWQVWPPTDPQAVSDQAAAEHGRGHAEIMLDRAPESYVIPDALPPAAELPDRLARHRAEHGPALREVRCDSTVLTYLTLRLQPDERKPYEPQPWGIPIIEDNDVPARAVRRVYDDGNSEDREVMSEAVYQMIRDMPQTLEFKPPTAPSRLTDLHRYGMLTEPFSISTITGL
jgi:hypothetical protein